MNYPLHIYKVYKLKIIAIYCIYCLQKFTKLKFKHSLNFKKIIQKLYLKSIYYINKQHDNADKKTVTSQSFVPDGE